jgi:hypothetical protein
MQIKIELNNVQAVALVHLLSWAMDHPHIKNKRHIFHFGNLLTPIVEQISSKLEKRKKGATIK